MRKRKIFAIATLSIIIAALLFAMPSASANSAQMYWHGVTSSGALVVGEDIPVVVNSEKIIFDIPAFPSSYYSSEDGTLENYEAAVTAIYEFENPADYDVNVRLAFPYGTVPDYADDTSVISSRYSVTVDGKDVQSKNRYTYFGGYGWSDDFVTEESTEKLLDVKKNVGWIDSDAKVAEYVYKVSNAPYELYTACVKTTESKNAKLFCESNSFQRYNDTVTYGQSMSNGGTVSFWFVYDGQEPAFELYAEKDGKKINDCEFKNIKHKEYSLSEFAQQSFPFDDESDTAYTDWFNIVVDYVADSEGNRFNSPFFGAEYFASSNVMRWYEYSLDIAAGAKIINTVTAPLFPDIDKLWEPAVYTYDYLLSPAKAWADFGTLDIEVNTPFEMLAFGDNGFERTENGFKAHFDSLPDGELSFRLSESADPQKKPFANPIIIAQIAIIVIAPILGIAEIVVLIVFVSVGASRRNRLCCSVRERKHNTLVATGIGFIACVAAAASLVTATVGIFAGIGSFGGAIAFFVTGIVFSLAVTATGAAIGIKCDFRKEPEDGKE